MDPSEDYWGKPLFPSHCNRTTSIDSSGTLGMLNGAREACCAHISRRQSWSSCPAKQVSLDHVSYAG